MATGAAGATRAAGADRNAHLLGDSGPELAKRWVSREAQGRRVSAASPNVSRGLLSAVLRGTSRGDALDAADVLRAARALPLEDAANPLERLGFGRRDARARFRAVLADLLEAALTQTALDGKGAALGFYCTAGAGANDEAEYAAAQSAAADPRNAKRVYPPDLEALRRGNVVFALEYCAGVFRQAVGQFEALEGASRTERAAFWKVLYALPLHAENLNQEELKCIMSVYGAVIRTESVDEQRIFVGELHTMFNTLAGFRKSLALGTIARALVKPVPILCMRASLSCLMTFMDRRRAAKAGACEDPMDIERYTKRFVVPLLKTKMEERAQAGVPALLVALSEAWLDAGEQEQFAAESALTLRLLEQLQAALKRLESHSVAIVEQDVLALRMVVAAISARAMLGCGILTKKYQEQ